MIRTLLLAGAVAVSFPAVAATMSGAEFARRAAATDQFEIQSSQLALQKASNAQVKDFANMMIRDHTKSTADLTAAAGAAKVPVDKTLDADKKNDLAKLQAAPAGAAFDKAYLAAQVKAHTVALQTMREYAASGTVAPLKTFAANTSKVVATHHEHVRSLSAAVK